MKTKTNTNNEIVVTAPDSVGILSRISTVISDAKVNIRAICGYEVDHLAHVRLITDDNKRAIEVLQKDGFKTFEHEVVVSELSPHYLHPEMAEYAGSYEVKNNFWCAATHSGEHAMLVFSPSDNINYGGIK